ncbi:MAG TPA: hypothetical protein ENN12_03500 [Epsilonproteobacteria bacterium]|nr:hypothetical protein [Campylobacterota bacterium]
MTLREDISALTLAKLEVVMIYGVSAFVLYIVAMVAIVAFEIRQAKQTAASTSMIPYITKTFLYVFGWFIGITLFILILISIMPGGGMNPAQGIDGFWHIDWLSPNTWRSLDYGVIASSGTPEQLSSARFIAIVMMVIKLVYHVLLIVFFFMIFSFIHSIPSLKTKQAGEEMSAAYAGNMFIHFVFTILVFQILMGVLGILLTGLLDLAVSLNKINMTSDTEVSIVYDLTKFVRIGVNKVNGEW